MATDNERKRPGKTATTSTTRRSTTRTAGFHATAGSTGGELRRDPITPCRLRAGQSVTIEFEIPASGAGLVGFGCWFLSTGPIDLAIDTEAPRRTLTQYAPGLWNKVGSLWKPIDNESSVTRVEITACADLDLAVVDAASGTIGHRHLDGARAELMRNMHQFAPEANFYKEHGTIKLHGYFPEPQRPQVLLYRKSCNRCGRMLPINYVDEQSSLSFSNHCTSAARRPCRHGGFGRMHDVADGSTVSFEYGFQLECRFCKKFEVNAAHNPQRTEAQMKEDAARRRAFELLLTELFEGSPSLLYRQETGRELVDDVQAKFGGNCFNCSVQLTKGWHLDHTRPLALLYPLDGTATPLCSDCNSSKRDLPPVAFYTHTKLVQLANLTGLPLQELVSVEPNVEAIRLLWDRKKWFFEEFLAQPQLAEVRDDKLTADLVVKALSKVIAKSPQYRDWNILQDYNRQKGR